MPRAKGFNLGLCSCLGHSTAASSAVSAEEKKEETKEEMKPYDFSNHKEHTECRLAVAASAGSKHHPVPDDDLVPWSHATAAEGATSEVCTLAPAPGAGLGTLFLRTTMSPTVLAKRLLAEFFDESKLSVKVS